VERKQAEEWRKEMKEEAMKEQQTAEIRETKEERGG
jgi:hypothetical protein